MQAPSGSTAATRQTDEFAVEEAMGADCGNSWITDPPLQEPACYGKLPEHLVSFLSNIPDGHPYLTAEQRDEAARGSQRFRAVNGYGQRPDFVAVIENVGLFWFRSFEGPDPDTTVFLVYGPDCIDSREATRNMECLPGAPGTIRELKAYRVRNGALPEEVTHEILPPAPRLTRAERQRYGIYLRPKEEGVAEDSDVRLDVRGLATTPVMRWVIDPPEEGDYEKPKVPDSDPRGFLGNAHFGFLVWTGKHFELREKVPLGLWACGLEPVDKRDCLDGFSSELDPYLVSDAMASSRPDTAP